MLNKLWGAMIVIGIAVAAFQGKIGNVGTAAIDSSKEAVMLCITMLGVMSMWTGIMNVAEKSRFDRCHDEGTQTGFCVFYFRIFPRNTRQMSTLPPISSPMCWDLAGRRHRMV